MTSRRRSPRPTTSSSPTSGPAVTPTRASPAPSALAAAVSRLGGPDVAATGSVEDTADHLAARVQPGDIVLAMGGGRSYVIAERLVALLEARADG